MTICAAIIPTIENFWSVFPTNQPTHAFSLLLDLLRTVCLDNVRWYGRVQYNDMIFGALEQHLDLLRNAVKIKVQGFATSCFLWWLNIEDPGHMDVDDHNDSSSEEMDESDFGDSSGGESGPHRLEEMDEVWMSSSDDSSSDSGCWSVLSWSD